MSVNPTPSALGTAIVTGASSGIGKMYAERLAARGYDLVLVARREDRLQHIAADLQARCSIRAQVLVADLSQPAGVAAVIDYMRNDDALAMLVNNAGVSAGGALPLTDTPDNVIAAMIALNITALTALSKAALVAFKKKGAGTIVNIGSGASLFPYPGIAIYASTKAYVYLFTQALQAEVAGTDIRVQLVTPGAVKSEGWDRAVSAGLNALPAGVVMSTEDCVDAALAGLDQGEAVTAPSLHDVSTLRDHEAAAGKLMQSLFNAQPAPRYSVS